MSLDDVPTQFLAQYSERFEVTTHLPFSKNNINTHKVATKYWMFAIDLNNLNLSNF